MPGWKSYLPGPLIEAEYIMAHGMPFFRKEIMVQVPEKTIEAVTEQECSAEVSKTATKQGYSWQNVM